MPTFDDEPKSEFTYTIVKNRPLSKISRLDPQHFTEEVEEERDAKGNITKAAIPAKPILVVPFTVKQMGIRGSRWLGGHMTREGAEAEIAEMKRVERRNLLRNEALADLYPPREKTIQAAGGGHF